MTRKTISAFLSLMVLLGSLPAADVIPGRWEKVDLLISKTPILIEMLSGEQFHCTFFSSNREVLLVVEPNGVLRRVRKAEVETVVAEKYDDRLRNGIVTGLLVGLAGAAALTLASHDPDQGSRVNTGVLRGVMLGLVGSGVGALVDYHHKGREVIFEARKN